MSLAGAGPELKRLFTKKRGYLGAANAYIISTVMTEGPMISCTVMMFALRKIMQVAGASYGSQEIFLVTTTYIMIFSLILSDTVLMLAGRYISDCVYEERMDQILPSSYSFILYLMIAGVLIGIPYILFLGIPPVRGVLNPLQFGTMLIVWVQISYLSAIKEYTRILLGLLMAAIMSVGLAMVFSSVGMNTPTASFLVSTMDFLVVMLMYMRELVCSHPKGEIDLFILFLSLDRYKTLIAMGFLMAVELFGHSFVYWFSNYRVEVIRGMVYCMRYDVSCFFASITIIPFLITFIVSPEVNFYRAYRRCFDSIQYGGALSNTRFERAVMEKTSFRELAHVFEIQLFVEIVCVSFLGDVPGYIGFEREMLIIYRYLYFGYCFYMLLGSLIILLLYSDDRKGVCLFSIEFAVPSVLFPVIVLCFDIEAYGIGFLATAVVTSVCRLVYLHRYIQKLEYHVFCERPLFYKEAEGVFQKASFQVRKLEGRFEKRLMKTRRKR